METASTLVNEAHLPTFIINLDRSADRWQTIRRNMDRIGLAPTRIEAVDGRNLQNHPGTRYLGAGVVACTMSHLKAMRALLNTDAPAALILEDDVEVGTSVPDIIRLVEWWPKGHGLVKLDSCYTERDKDRVIVGEQAGTTPDGRALHPIVFQHMGAYGYLIDRATAEKAVDAESGITVPIDQFLFAPRGTTLKNSPFACWACPLQMMPGAVRHPPYSERRNSEVRAAGRHAYVKRIGLLKMRRRHYKKGFLGRLAEKRAMTRILDAGHAYSVHVPFED